MTNTFDYYSDVCFDVCTRVGQMTNKAVGKHMEEWLGHYAYNILVAMRYPTRHSMSYETVINGIANSAAQTDNYGTEF